MSRLQRVGVEELPRHLEATYGIRVAAIEELDLGVYRVERADGRSWVARLLPAERPIEQTRGDAEVLRVLAELEFPAERCAAAEPVSVLEGQAVLVTEFVPGVPRAGRREAIRKAGGLAALGRLLGRLHTLPSREATARPGGAWHHLADGAPADEIAALGRLLDNLVRPATSPGGGLYETLEQQVRSLDDGRVERTVAGYRQHVIPEPDELERLEALIHVRPTIFDTWAFCTGRKTLAQAAASIAASRDTATAIADRARAAFATCY